VTKHVTPIAPEGQNRVFVARQPILRLNGQIFGYELLYRGAAADTGCKAPGDLASARVLTDTLLTLGLDTLTDGHIAFINITRELLFAGAAELLPQKTVVLELLEDIFIDRTVVDACRELAGRGYALALDDFEVGSPSEELMPHVKYVKVDVLATTPASRLKLAKRLLPLGITLIAEKVETEVDVSDARQAGYGLLQGYFFCRPMTIGGSTVSPERLSSLRLLAQLNRPDITIIELEEIVKRDVALSYRVLRSVNSAAFGVRQSIQSIRQALLMLGTSRIRQWASIWALAGVNAGGTTETMTLALIRARACEQIVTATAGAEVAAEYFLLGLCSLLDVMLCCPMAAALVELPLSVGMRNALLGTRNAERGMLDAVMGYERGDWDGAASAAVLAGIPFDLLPPAYEDALRWSRELTKIDLAA
jgi:EAL and modified HD-GYP domain-containing signal transduction protein